MNNIFLILLIILSCHSCKNTDKVEKVAVATELVVPDFDTDNFDEKTLVGFGCSYDGQPSEAVQSITKILQARKYADLLKKISSDRPAEKYLATFACLKLLKKKKIELDCNQLAQMAANEKSDLLVYFCAGCTQNGKYKLSQLFSEKNGFTREVEDWFKRIK